MVRPRCSLCADIVTHGDLQHHRWVLETVDREPLDTAGLDNKIPELDFGELMHVSGNSGCNRLSGRAVFDDTRLDFGNLASTTMSCLPAQDRIEATVLQVLGNKPQVKLRENYLELSSDSTELRYRLRDWVD